MQKYRQIDGSTDEGLRDTVHAREDLLSRSGLLVPRGDGRASFYHLSFQEFMAAERLVLELSRAVVPPGIGGDGFPSLLIERGQASGWRNTLSFLFGCLVTKFSPDVGAGLLQAVVKRMELPAVDVYQRGQAGGFWNLAIVLGDCLEILIGRKSAVPPDLREFFQRLVMRAIEQEIAVKDRHTLAVALGRLGDPRIVADLRVQGHPDEHPGYVKIPAGDYYYGDDKQRIRIDEPFWLSRYPVTNSQYQLFMDKEGYEKEEFWSKDGWRWMKKEGVIEPKFWRNPRFSAPNQPVVGVSWWEAEAFATWAGGKLPTERQWETAARGPHGYVYPWDDEWEDGLCNSREAGLGSTSAVGIFPRDRSVPFGVEDMAGNVWEWCADEEASVRVFRGGSWCSSAGDCRAAIRRWFGPSDRDSFLGFRVAPVRSGGQAGSSKLERTEPGVEAEGAE